ncbi:MAG TPA: AAA family ATPase [Blastocatellia bacterium]|nr:AAA family ATPase [Blastocatellia bacterium]
MPAHRLNLGLQPTIISVAGHIGSGKSEVCRQLKKLTGWDVISAGAIMRNAALQREMSIVQINKYAESHAEIDNEVDSYLSSLAQSPAPLIVDARLAWHFLPSSLKVYLVVEERIAAQRVFDAGRSDEKYPSIQAASESNRERQRLERARYLDLYSIDCGSWRNYDLIIDTSQALPEQIARVVWEQLEQPPVLGASGPRCWLSPQRLIPTQELRQPPRPGGAAGTAVVEIAVYQGSYLIVDGHAGVSEALRQNLPIIPCRLVAFESEELSPGLSLSTFAQTATSLSRIRRWEESHIFRYMSYPQWLNENGSQNA